MDFFKAKEVQLKKDNAVLKSLEDSLYASERITRTSLADHVIEDRAAEC